jgi:hypothetical protein
MEKGSQQDQELDGLALETYQQIKKGDLTYYGIFGELERRVCRVAIEECEYVITRAAKSLHVERTTLSEKMKAFGIPNRRQELHGPIDKPEPKIKKGSCGRAEKTRKRKVKKGYFEEAYEVHWPTP